MQATRSTWEILGALGAHAWSRELVVPGSSTGTTVGEAFDGLLAFALEGDGRLSERDLVGRTAAARDALAGEAGTRLQGLLRATLATFDGREALTNLHGFILADTPERVTLATGAAYANIINDMGIRPFRPTSAPTAAMRRDAIGALKIGLASSDYAGFAPDWAILSPVAALPLLRAAREGTGSLPAETAVAAARSLAVARHEIAHTIDPVVDPSKAFGSQRITPFGFPLDRLLTLSRVGWLADRGLLDQIERRSVSPLLWLEEATADLDSTDQREGAALLGRVGLPVNEQTVGEFRAGYPAFAVQLDRLLRLADIDRTTVAGLERARTVLQGAELSDTPQRLGDAIAAAHGGDAALATRIAGLIAAAGSGSPLGERELPEGFVERIDEIERIVA